MIEKVLLIDDDEITLLICEIVIKSEKFAKQVILFKNGQEGIDYFKELVQAGKHKTEQVPALVFLDLNMPVMNGWEFLEEFAQHYADSFPDIKICILTSSVDPLDLTNSKIHDNVVGFINKPLTAERLNELKANDEVEHLFISR